MSGTPVADEREGGPKPDRKYILDADRAVHVFHRRLPDGRLRKGWGVGAIEELLA